MLVSYHPIKSEENCALCELSLKDSAAVAHRTQHGHLEHAVHRACIDFWTDHSESCHVCHDPIDLGSLYTWQERAKRKVRLFAKDCCFGATEGTQVHLLSKVLRYWLTMSATQSDSLAIGAQILFHATGVKKKDTFRLYLGAGALATSAVTLFLFRQRLGEFAKDALIGIGTGLLAAFVRKIGQKSALSRTISNRIAYLAAPVMNTMLNRNQESLLNFKFTLSGALSLGTLGLFYREYN